MATAAPLSSPPREATPRSLPQRGSQGGLRELDELLRTGGARGFVHVQGAPAVLDALALHVERRARATGRPVVSVRGLPTDEAWREVAARMGAAAIADPAAAAQAILEKAGDAVVVVRSASATAWGRAVAEEVGSQTIDRAALFVVLGEAPGAGARAPSASKPAPATTRARVIEVDAAIGADEVRLWWEAVANDAEPSFLPRALDRIDALEAWWAAARSTPLDQRLSPVELGPDARRFLARVLLLERSFPAGQASRLGPLLAFEELVAKGALAVDREGRLVAGAAVLPAIEGDAADALAAAEALEVEPDPWARARAAELFARAGRLDRAEEAALGAIGALAEPVARADFWDRWERALATQPADRAEPLVLRAAELALRVGDLERALSFARALAARSGDSFDVLLMLGRTTRARGDLGTASIALGKALERASSPAARAVAAAELADVHYAAGDVEAACLRAEEAIGAAVHPKSRLDARNVLGKILLARGAWAEAEVHFAADACEAALAGDLTSELRARLNRAIALLSSGRWDEARTMLTSVLEDGERHGELRAVAFALLNLSTIAILKHEYGDAFRFGERAFEVYRRLGDKLTMAILTTNLADLRVALGQVAEAEQTLAFGRKACGSAIAGARLSHIALVAARIHLARGNTIAAAAELNQAVAAVPFTSTGNRLAECHLLAARIALEEGDVARAAEALARARDTSKSDKARAESALLEAQRARAAGEPFEAAARAALDLARAAQESEFLREAHVLLHLAALLSGDAAAARAHLESAIVLRESMVTALPSDMRARFLERRELVQLAALEAAARLEPAHPRARARSSIAAPSDEGACERCGDPACDGGSCSFHPRAALRPERAGKDAPPRRIVGRDPAIVALLHAVQKVGPSDATVLIRGESGTGKELVAEALHEASPRRGGPMVKVNCAALVETLLLSELFGHEKGSFTGAAARKRGRFEMAEGGTIFLDEIGDISPRTQVALLRVLQEKTFERVGGVTPIRANVRIVCATHRDLRAMVARGEFREDLYYRLRGVVLEVPALRSRLGDLGPICAAILARIAAEQGAPVKRLSARALEGLTRHTWPGNIRELENAIRAAALFAEGEALDLEDFTDNVDGLRGVAVERWGGPGTSPNPPSAPSSPEGPCSVAPVSLAAPVSGVQVATGSVLPASVPGTGGALDVAAMVRTSRNERSGDGAQGPSAPPSSPSSSPTEIAYAHVRGGVSLSDLKRQIERECIARALTESGGNITRAASLLGMKRPRLSQLVKQYGFGGDGFGLDVDSVDSEET